MPCFLRSHFFSVLSVSTVLLKFRTDKGRDPDPQSFAEDSELLRQIRDDVLEALAVSSDLLNEDFIRYLVSLFIYNTITHQGNTKSAFIQIQKIKNFIVTLMKF